MHSNEMEDLKEQEISSAHPAGSSGESDWKRRSDSVYLLNSAELSGESAFDCVFLHGLPFKPTREAHKVTWISRTKPSEVWLNWLYEINPSIRILAVSYEDSIKKDSNMDLYLVAENLLGELTRADVGKNRPFIFVCHCFGGIVAKAVCRRANERKELYTTFLQNLKGFCYFGVPHRGYRSLTDIVGKTNIAEGEWFEYVKVSSNKLSRLNELHDLLRNEYDWKVTGLGESLPTELENGRREVLVEEASARYFNFMIVPDADHYSICQPNSRDSSSYQFLETFIETILAQVTMTAEDMQDLPQIKVGLLKEIPEISRKVEEIHQELEKHKALGFWGMVGVGKTTLCKYFFNALWNAFPYTLFAEGVKQIPGDEREFEETVLSLVHHKGKKITPAPNLVQLRGKKLLVAFDDVEKDREIELLRKLSRTLLSSSRFIVASQNRQMLNKIDGIHIVRVAPLDGEDSKLLFKTRAFPDNQPLQEWQTKCMEEIVQACGGLPSSLYDVADYLKKCDDKAVWQQINPYLMNGYRGDFVGRDKVWKPLTMSDKVWKPLTMSYDKLGPEEKQMFLEAATFFQERFVENHGWRHGQRQWTLSEAKVIWSMIYQYEALHWKTLVDRSLVSQVPDDSVIRIHELLKRFGHSLTDNDDFKIRVDSVENLLNILQDVDRKIKNVHTLQVVCEEISGQYSTKICLKCRIPESGGYSNCEHLSQRLPLHEICSMERLRCLQLVDCEVEKGKATLPRSVVVFSSQNSGKNISFAKSSLLVYLSMTALKIDCLPESVCGLSNLQFLHLEAGNLRSLPDNFGSLQKLRLLKLVAQKLKRLPDSFSRLQDLQKIHLECDRLKCLPESIGHLTQLQELNLKCQTLVSLPPSIGELLALQDLSLRCNALEILPDRFGALVGLQKLELQCDKLQSIPEFLARLSQLRELILVCQNLRRLPRSFLPDSEALEYVCLQCDSLEGVPDSLVAMQALHTREVR
ncbi:protein SERAC1 [Marchantia polymorpha subsp. ruderalis]|uniref:NB-ARC domain-containing protein n=2 Tax=Marchantia polymorpha TaxID=3197 RepID=A0AAF6B7P5_MARPO|nr:hypothetical protein MARPO_0120s0019 [Marchantia polymorpha]BBN08029.1 hypothetical protein Mp_4g08270 [Marchantia polymorpha subsp. ruderalis]|eukprot:PTQ30743.1 hypothetical protein MARPO_0120s0019 [Marchantia polymorpha]